uniref:Integrase catalytic domain-containing protein n=1 Tax=Bracon brevicornis TaxID=1563983 RepID=A0A6V7INH8_9HYME
MGALPAARVEPAAAFTRTGLDYAGPFSLQASEGRGRTTSQGYLAVFVRMCTKAVHLEIIGNLTTASFNVALQRFAARKSTPREIWPENATAFHGADAELRTTLREASLGWTEVGDRTATQGITSHFIPPSAPHFGGL